MTDERKCLNCGKEIARTKNKSYCSRACRNQHLTRRDMEEAPKYPKTCKICGKEFLARRPTKKYCSDKCNWVAQWEKKKAKRGVRPPQGKVWAEKRRIILDQQNGKCWLCGEPKERYHLHHKEFGDHSVDTDDLVVLCSSCHTMVHGITVSWQEDGTLTFHGRALDLLKEKGYEMEI